MKNRPARVRELIQRELGAIIAREMNFTSLVTVQAVDLTADFKHSHVHVGVLGDERTRRDVIQALAERRPYLQHEMAKRVILKYTPQLHFHLDHSVERGTKVMEILRQIDEITPPTEATASDDAVSPRAAKDAADMAAQDREVEEAARREVETDGADDEQDGAFDELVFPVAAEADAPKAKEERPNRPSRGTEKRAALQGEDTDE